MVENQRINNIRQQVRDWMLEAVSDEDSKHGKALQDEIRKHWPALFADTPERPVTNRDALAIAALYLADAVAFLSQSEEEDSIRRHAELLKVDRATIEMMRNKTIIAEKNLRAFQASMITLSGTGELSLTDTEKHLRNARLGTKVLRAAEETVRGTLAMGEIFDQPEKAALVDALDHTIINFAHARLRQAIEGRGRDMGGEAEAS